jgi:hypothetical protein
VLSARVLPPSVSVEFANLAESVPFAPASKPRRLPPPHRRCGAPPPTGTRCRFQLRRSTSLAATASDAAIPLSPLHGHAVVESLEEEESIGIAAAPTAVPTSGIRPCLPLPQDSLLPSTIAVYLLFSP